jgi:long-chain fatty acid transport protein
VESIERRRGDLLSTRRGKSGLFILVALVIFFPAVKSAEAGEERYTNIIVGERPAGMGGAYAAVSDDTTGLFYNPAGTVFSGGKSVSVSTNGYYTSTATYKNTIGEHDWVRNSSTLLPNFFGIIQPLGSGVFGFSYAVPDAIYENQDQVFLNVADFGIKDFAFNFNKEDYTYNFGPSYAMEINSNFAIGLTLYYHSRRYQMIQTTYQVFEEIPSSEVKDLILHQQRETGEKGVKPILGIMFTPTEGKYSIGLSVSTVALTSSDIIFQTYAKKALTDYGIEQYTAEPYRALLETMVFDGYALTKKLRYFRSDKRNYPVHVKTGFAYFPSNDLLLALDVNYYTATEPVAPIVAHPIVTTAGVPLLLFEEKRSVLNVSIGAEYYTSDTMAVRVGIFSDKTNNLPIGTPSGGNATSTKSSEFIDFYGMSASVTNFSKGSSLTLGATYSAGKGRANKNDIYEEDADISSLLIFLGSSYAY